MYISFGIVLNTTDIKMLYIPTRFISRLNYKILHTDVVPHIVVGIGAISAVDGVSISCSTARVIGKLFTGCIVSNGRSISPVEITTIESENCVCFGVMVRNQYYLECVVLLRSQFVMFIQQYYMHGQLLPP